MSVSPARGALCSGTQSQRIKLTATVAATIARNACRQFQTRSNSSSGTVAVIAPSAPAENATLFRVEMRSGGYHSTNAVKEDKRQPEPPPPSSAGAPTAEPNES